MCGARLSDFLGVSAGCLETLKVVNKTPGAFLLYSFEGYEIGCNLLV